MSWNFTNDKPIFQQIVDRITLDIIRGEFPPGAKLDAVRELAVTAGVNPNTMQRALAEIENSGLVVSKRGDGRYVTEDTARIEAMKKAYVAERARIYAESVKALGLGEKEMLDAVQNILSQGG